MSKSNSRGSKKMMVRGRSIQPRSEYQIKFGHFKIINNENFVLFVLNASKMNNYPTLTHKWSKTGIVQADLLRFDKYSSYLSKI